MRRFLQLPEAVEAVEVLEGEVATAVAAEALKSVMHDFEYLLG